MATWKIENGKLIYYGTGETPLISIDGLNLDGVEVDAAGNIDGLTFDKVQETDILTIADSLTGDNQVSVDGAGYIFKFEGDSVNQRG